LRYFLFLQEQIKDIIIIGVGGGVFINIKYMYNNDVGKEGVQVYEAYEVR